MRDPSNKYDQWLQDMEEAQLLTTYRGKSFDELPEPVKQAIETLLEGSSFEKYKPYVDQLKLPQALWWFIENIPDDDADRSEWTFYLRTRYRKEVK